MTKATERLQIYNFDLSLTVYCLKWRVTSMEVKFLTIAPIGYTIPC